MNDFLQMLSGFGVTLELFFLTLLFAIPLGLAIALGAMSKLPPLRWFLRGVIWVVRGTPLLLQCILVSFIPSVVFHLKNKDVASFFNLKISELQFVFVLIAFVLNYACYFAVIYEGGIKSIPQGQYEAGAVLGLTKRQTFFHVVFPQVIRRIIQPMSNEIITLVKDTALAKALAVVEILSVANDMVNISGKIWPLLGAGAFYLLFSGLLTVFFRFVEKKTSYYKV